MKILFLSYWGIGEGLTAATVFPHIKILADFDNIESVLLVTIERDNIYNPALLPEHPKITHLTLTSKRLLPNIINKIYDFVDFPAKLKAICNDHKIDKIIARGAPPGALAMKVAEKTGIPFYVESFEPHSAYMFESNTWKWYDPRYKYQKKWEKQQYVKATALMPVAENYRKALIAEGVNPEKIDVIPCCVPLENFKFNYDLREKKRMELNCKESLTGIYTGKFGGIYYREEAFGIFREAFDYFGEKLYLIILTPDEKKWVLKMISKYNLPSDRLFVGLVKHADVPLYLSAADFAFSLQSPKPSNLYLSPIKNAEYWANGLPILMTSGVGDDAQILQDENAGAVFRGAGDKKGIRDSLAKIESLINEPKLRTRLFKIADRYRNFQRVQDVYTKWYT